MANLLNLFWNGDVGFIEWLGSPMLPVSSALESHFGVTNSGTTIFGIKSAKKCTVIVIQRFRL